jgi:Ca2+-dependent lipid-binding protein
LEARLERDTELFGKMDPYCEIEMRMQRFRTATQGGAGFEPSWNENMVLDVKYIGDDMTVRILDENVIDSDLICEGRIKLSALCVNGGLDEWHQLDYKG